MKLASSSDEKRPKDFLSFSFKLVALFSEQFLVIFLFLKVPGNLCDNDKLTSIC